MRYARDVRRLALSLLVVSLTVVAVQAFGDLDDDGVFSTFERAGAADEIGINAAAGLYVDRELE
jgi:hypothetical protein